MGIGRGLRVGGSCVVIALLLCVLAVGPAWGAGAPVVRGVISAFGPQAGGASVLIKGSELTEVTAVDFGSTPATSFSPGVQEGTIRATAPPGTGTVDVRVTTPAGTSAIAKVDHYTYVDPPEFGTCERVGSGRGKFTATGCQIEQNDPEGNVEAEWYPGFGTEKPLLPGQSHFTLDTSKAVRLESVGKRQFTCADETGAGQITGPKTVALGALTLTGCKDREASVCSSSGATAGEISTSPLQGQIGDTSVDKTNSTKDVVGVALATGSEAPIAQFSCGAGPITLRGSVILGLKTPNKMRSTMSWQGVEVRGVQKTTHFVEQPEAVLEIQVGDEAPFERAGLKITATGETEDLVEFNTTV
jgi:hypothetical protein